MNNFKFVELRKILIADTYMGFLILFTNMLHGSNQRLVVESKMCNIINRKRISNTFFSLLDMKSFCYDNQNLNKIFLTIFVYFSNIMIFLISINKYL